LAKKLKHKIEQMCGLATLDWEARQDKANEILNSIEWKQQYCNELIGLTFRDLERILIGIASKRQKREAHDAERRANGEEFQRKSMQRNGSRAKPNITTNNKHRSIQEILAQVYAPRVIQDIYDEERNYTHSCRFIATSDNISSNSNDGDDKPKE
jgi:hypothetical protein